MLETRTHTFYEVHESRSFGARFSETYQSKKEAAQAIKERNEQAIKKGYSTSNYYIMFCSIITIRDSKGDIVSESITRVRV